MTESAASTAKLFLKKSYCSVFSRMNYWSLLKFLRQTITISTVNLWVLLLKKNGHLEDWEDEQLYYYMKTLVYTLLCGSTKSHKEVEMRIFFLHKAVHQAWHHQIIIHFNQYRICYLVINLKMFKILLAAILHQH